MNILAISGSIRPGSSNTAVIRALQKMAPSNIHINLYESLGSIPPFDPSIAAEAATEPVVELRNMLKNADAVIICTPEYAFGVPGILKNALDWLVSSAEMNTMPVVAISVSPLYSGGKYAHDSLVLTLTALGTNLHENCKLRIADIYNKMNAEKEVTDPTTLNELSDLLTQLIKVVNTPKEF